MQHFTLDNLNSFSCKQQDMQEQKIKEKIKIIKNDIVDAEMYESLIIKYAKTKD